MDAGGQKTGLSFVVAVASLAIAAATFWHVLNNDDIRQALDHEHRLSNVEAVQQGLGLRVDRLEREEDGRAK